MPFNAGIIATGCYLPPKKLSNKDLEKIVETTSEWISTRTGISERRIVDENIAASDLAVKAGEELLKNSNLFPEEIDFLIIATGTPDRLFPSTASRAAHLLKLREDCGAFDLLAACAGFNYALEIGVRMIECGKYRNIMVIGSEALSKFLDWEDRTTCILFGDGAGGVIISRVREEFGFMDSQLFADGSLTELLQIPAGGSLKPASLDTIESGQHYIKMNGREVFKYAVSKLSDACELIIKKNNLKVSEIDLFVAHQANERIMRAIADRLGFKNNQVYMNIERYGNTSSASIPIALHEASREGMLKEGSLVLLASFGAGFVWGVTLLRFGGGF